MTKVAMSPDMRFLRVLGWALVALAAINAALAQWVYGHIGGYLLTGTALLGMVLLWTGGRSE
jgi:hypothetical protein